jgi:hypothetical protein
MITEEQLRAFDICHALQMLKSETRRSEDFPETIEGFTRTFADFAHTDGFRVKIENGKTKILVDGPAEVAGGWIKCTKSEVDLEVDHPIVCAGSAVVFRGFLRDAKNIGVAIKIPRLSQILYGSNRTRRGVEEYGSINTEAKVREKENFMHRNLSHPNIARILDLPEWKLLLGGSTQPIQVTLTEWVDQAQPLMEHLRERCRSIDEAVDVVGQCFGALAYSCRQN